ncbi:unnamed protein product [Eruca vesicaria subsp. sativa]|uniref:Exoribonuclease phosphorolytic domain-containing protein n=1 Tax=Eruca vesicaria subsp. sativa TaxID=29727 RepID=A0ABC8L573_ERUVS|nr:unnamed protein product [Eruca vesicaria subsp. sativa]
MENTNAKLRTILSREKFKVHLSVMFSYREQGAETTTFGPRESKKATTCSNVGRLNCNVSYTTFADPALGSQGTDHKEYSSMLHKALKGVMLMETFPKTNVDVFALVLESGGSDLPVVISCASLALADIGIMMYHSCFSGKSLMIDPVTEMERCEDGSLMMTCMPTHYEITQLTITGNAALRGCLFKTWRDYAVLSETSCVSF